MSQRQIRGRRKRTDDVTPPTGRWVNRTPAPGTDVSGEVWFDMLASDNRGLNYVQFLLNGETIGGALVNAASAQSGHLFSKKLNTRAFANGSYNVAAYIAASDGPGHTKNLGTIRIQNEEESRVSIVSPSEGTTVSLPWTIDVLVCGAGSVGAVSNVAVQELAGALEMSFSLVSGTTWRATASTYLETTAALRLLPIVTFNTGDRLYGQVVNVNTGTVGSQVSAYTTATWTVSNTSPKIGETITFTPTVSASATGALFIMDLYGDQATEMTALSGSYLSSAVSFAYTVTGTVLPVVNHMQTGYTARTLFLPQIFVSANTSAAASAPAISITSPASGASVSGQATISFTATDASGISKVTPYIASVAHSPISYAGAVLTSVAGTFAVDTSAYANTAISIYAVLENTNGITATAAAITVNVQNSVASTPATSSAVWYDWATEQPFTSLTETRRNMSGTTQAYAPVTFLAQFHPGEIPTTKKLKLKDNSGTEVADNAWQWGERSTFPDGSLRSCVVRCYGPASWTASTDQTFTIETTAGSWPAETDSRPNSTVAANSNVRLILEDITTLGKPYGSTTQSAYSGGATLDFDLNRAMARAHVPRKRTAGAIMTQWYTWEKLKVPGSAPGAGGDAELWCKCWVNVWYVPGTNTVRHMSVHPLLMNGWARVQGFLKAFKMRLVNGGTTLRDFSPSFTRTQANWTGTPVWPASWQATFVKNDWNTFDYLANEVRPGNAVKITGSVPNGITAGKIYMVKRQGGGYYDAGYGAAFEGFVEGIYKPFFTLAPLGNFQGSGAPDMDPGTGGGTHTFTVMQYMEDKNCFPIRDKGGEEFWPVGGTAYIWPNWSRAQKIRRMQVGQVPNVPIELNSVDGGNYQGRPGNGLKNTQLGLIGNQFQVYQPGGTSHHCVDMEDAGYYQPGFDDQGKHKGECSYHMLNVLNDMCPSGQFFPWHRVQRQAAAEGISWSRELGAFDNGLDANGIEYATHVCINNGPNKNGTQYSGMGPCFEGASIFENSGIYRKGSPPNFVYDESTANHWSYSRMSGSHVTKEYVYCYALYCDPADLEMTTQLYIRTSINPQSSGSKVYNGVTYHRISVLALTPGSVTRDWIARNLFLGYALWTPDNEPVKAMLDDIVEDNINWFNLVYDDPAYLGSTVKIVNMAVGVGGGGEQWWQLQRVSYGALFLAKMSGIQCPKVVDFHTAGASWYWGKARHGGVTHPYAKTGHLGYAAGIYILDKANSSGVGGAPSADEFAPEATRYWLRDAASRSTDASTVYIAAQNGSAYFQTDGFTFRYRMYDTYQPTLQQILGSNWWPENGDKMIFSPYNSLFNLPTGVAFHVPYWLYNKTLVRHYVHEIPRTGSDIAPGMTLTQGAKTATVLTVHNGSGTFYGEHTVPAGGNFTAGTVTVSNGATLTYPSFADSVYSYRLSSTNVASTTTPVTWSTGTEKEMPSLWGIIPVNNKRNAGPFLGGRIGKAALAGNWISHVTGPLLAGATWFGPSADCDAGLAEYRSWLADFKAGQGYDHTWLGHNVWVHHNAYPPGAT